MSKPPEFFIAPVAILILTLVLLPDFLLVFFQPRVEPSPRPATFLLPRDPAVILLVSPLDDDQITTDTLAGLHAAGLLAYRAAVQTELTLIAKGRRP